MHFEIVNKQLVFPYEIPPFADRKLPTVKDKGWTKVGEFELRKDIDYIPQVGLQEQLCSCDCNLVFICGQATSGKTFAMLLNVLEGMDYYGYTARLISVRLQDSKKGSSIFRDAVTVCGNFANCEYNSSDYPTFMWRIFNSNLQLIHSNFNADNPAEWEEFQDYAKKNQASYIAIDEATEIKQFKMFAYWFSRNRDSSGMIPQMVLSFNPNNEHWTTKMLLDAGYIGEDWFLKPEMIGKVRYFYNKGDSPSEIIWGNTREEVADRAGLVDKPEDIAAGIDRLTYVKSFTVLTGTASDNRELVNATKGQSVANLHAVGATQRRVVGEAYFGPVENEELNVTRNMIHGLWTNPINDDENMYATLDVSGGGENSDNCPMIIWKGLQIIAIKLFTGTLKELVEWIDVQLKTYHVPVSNFAFDATGIGNYLRSYTSGMPITANKRTVQELDENGNPVTLEQYFNLRSQLLGRMKVLLEKGEVSCAVPKEFTLPYGKRGETRQLIQILFDEMNVFTTTSRNNKIYYRSKDEYKSKFHHSPDLMDAISFRAIFELDARPKKQPQSFVSDDAYDSLYSDDPDDEFAMVDYNYAAQGDGYVAQDDGYVAPNDFW
jgi:hypothetical protein